MKNKQKPTPDYSLLLDEAAKKLGTAPGELDRQIKRGDLSEAVKTLPPAQQAMLNKALGDKAACERLLASPQAQALIKKLSGK